jgi:hypothetical protein
VTATKNGMGHDLLAKLAAVRATREGLLAERAQVAARPLPRDVVVERMRAYITAVGEMGLTGIRDRAVSFLTPNGVPNLDAAWLLGSVDPWNVGIIVHRLCGDRLVTELVAGLDGRRMCWETPTRDIRG